MNKKSNISIIILSFVFSVVSLVNCVSSPSTPPVMMTDTDNVTRPSQTPGQPQSEQSAGTENAQGLSLLEAIEQSAERIASELSSGTRVAIVAFQSGNDNLSDFIMEELTGALFDRGIEVADRQNLEYVFRELNFQMSGNVDDDTAKSIGKFLAADMVITGDLTDLDIFYRYRTSAVNVETAVRASVTRLDVRADTAMRRMVTALASQQSTVRTAGYGVSADKTPQTAGTFLDRGILFASRGEYGNAIADFTEALRLNPNLIAAYLLRGRALYASVSRVTDIAENFSYVITSQAIGRAATPEEARVYDQAIEDFTRAVRLDPNNVIAYHNRGIAYSHKGDFDLAIEDYDQAIRLDPNRAGNYNSRGSAYWHKGDFDRAITDFDQAIRLDPNHANAYLNRGEIYGTRGDLDRAIMDFDQAIRLNPNNADAYYSRGNKYGTRGDLDRAIMDFDRAIRLDPNNAGSYRSRGYAYFHKGDMDRAFADYNQAMRIDPNNVNAYNVRGSMYSIRGDLDRAIADFEAALRIDPNNSDAKLNLENARRQRGR